MNTQETKIQCPHCKNEIDINEIVYEQLQQQLKDEFKKKLINEKSKIEKKLREELREESSEEIKSYKEQLAEKIKETKDFNKIKADFEKIKREKNELYDKLKAESEMELTQKLENEKKKIRKDFEDKNELKLAEKDHLINQLNEQLKETQRKLQQGSVQSQGEVQELIIEEFLRTNFPMDKIEEVRKGVRGADCFHIINTPSKQNCGTIYYESKRTKDFQNSWIEKFKRDIREKGATYGVLVSDAYPKGVERLTQIQGIWVCSFDEFRGLCFVLRESAVLLDTAIAVQENKGTKMEMLYQYLTGNEFRMQIEAIVEGFIAMQNDLESERRAMENIWKKREYQIRKVVQNTTHMYSSVKGIAGSAVGTIKALELPSSENNNT